MRAPVVLLCKCGCGRPVDDAKYPAWRPLYVRDHSPVKRASLAERFWKKVRKTDQCWVWNGGGSRGYGHIRVNGKCVLAHRVSWELHNGLIPEGLDVLHRCDNPPCVNPTHLFLGTDLDNVRDMVAKGRHAFGTKHAHAQLTTEQVSAIREIGWQCERELAARFGVSVRNIRAILRREIWRNVSRGAA